MEGEGEGVGVIVSGAAISPSAAPSALSLGSANPISREYGLILLQMLMSVTKNILQAVYQNILLVYIIYIYIYIPEYFVGF